MIKYEPVEANYSPNTEELDRNVDRKGFLECIRLLPPKIIDARKHLVGERNLLVVTSG
jgi:hypothetical protein